MTDPVEVALLQVFEGAETESGRTLHLTPASAIKVRPVRWLWDQRMPLGALTLVGGREGIGKTICCYTLAADITRGRLTGAYAQIPRSVIVAATEDSWEHTIVPRLMAAGANLDLVFRVDVTTTTGVETAMSLPVDLLLLNRVIRKVEAAAVILDPLLSRLDPNIDTHKDADVRRALEPLASLAADTDAAVIGIIHVNKSTSSDVLTTLMASRAFAAVARAVLFVMADPDDEHMRLVGQGKNNLGTMDVPTLAFRIVAAKVAETDDGPVWTGKLEWAGEASRSIKQAVEAAAASAGDRTATSEAGDWLEDFLVEHGGSADWAAVQQQGTKAGHSKDALRRANDNLKITSKTSGFPRKAIWTLPAPLVAAIGETATTATTASNATNGRSVDAVGAVGALNASLPGLRLMRDVPPFDPDPTGNGIGRRSEGV
jgi:hypothetical protein